MNRAQALIAAAAGGLAAAGGAVEPAREPDYYVCSADLEGAFGHIWHAIEVPVDGSPRFHRIQWQSPARAEGVTLAAQRLDWDPAPERLDDRTQITILFATRRPGRGEVRLELRRRPGPHYPEEFAFAGPFSRAARGDGGERRIDAPARWDEIAAWMNGRDALTAAIVRRDGSVVAEDRLDAALLAMPAAAIAAIRPALDEKIADYRARCEEPGAVLITRGGPDSSGSTSRADRWTAGR